MQDGVFGVIPIDATDTTVEKIHVVTRLEIVDVVTDLNDLAGAITAQDQGERVNGIGTGPKLGIDGIHPGRV